MRWHADVYSGGTPSRDVSAYWSDGSIPWLASGAVNQWEITQPSEFITERGFKESAARWVPENAVVMGLAGQGRTKGMVARTAIRATCNQSMCAIIPDRSLEHRFLHFWLSVNHDNIRNLAGGDKRDGLNHEHVRSIVIPLPPAGVQARIADYLDHETAEIDAMEADLDRLVETLRQRRSQAIEDALAGDYSRAPLWTITDAIIDCPHTTPVLDPLGPAEAVRTASVRNGHYLPGKGIPVSTQTAAKRNGASPPRSGDIFFTREAPAGEACVVPDGQFCLGQRMVLIRPSRDKLDSSFLVYAIYTRTIQDAFKDAAGGSTVVNLKLGTIRSTRIPIPTLREQRRIVAELDEQTSRIDDMIAGANRLKGLLAERRSTLITDVVTGKKEVPA